MTQSHDCARIIILALSSYVSVLMSNHHLGGVTAESESRRIASHSLPNRHTRLMYVAAQHVFFSIDHRTTRHYYYYFVIYIQLLPSSFVFLHVFVDVAEINCILIDIFP